MSKYLLLGSATDLGVRFLGLAAKSKLQIKCLYRDKLPRGRINQHPIVVSALGGTPIPLRLRLDSHSDPRVLEPILEDLDGVVCLCPELPPRRREPEIQMLGDTVVSLMRKSTRLRRLLIWTKIPRQYPHGYDIPSAQTEAFLKGVQSAEGLDWTIVRSGRWLDDVAGPNDEQGERRLVAAMKDTPPGGIELGANSGDSVWKEDMSRVLLEVLKADGLTGRTLDVKSVKATKDNGIEKVIAELAASPKEKSEPEKSV